MDEMIEEDRLIHGFPSKDREEVEEGRFRLILKPVIGYNGDDKDKDDADRNKKSLSHRVAGSKESDDLIQFNELSIVDGISPCQGKR